MPKIIQVLDVNSDGHRVRLDNGQCLLVPHGTGQELNVGDELGGEPIKTIAPSLEHLNSPEQFAANVLSEIIEPHGESNASSEPSAAPGDGDSRASALEAEAAE